jgi:hypothetical protein
MRSQELFPCGWPWTKILLISASQIARITGVSHQSPWQKEFLMHIVKKFREREVLGTP